MKIPASFLALAAATTLVACGGGDDDSLGDLDDIDLDDIDLDDIDLGELGDGGGDDTSEPPAASADGFVVENGIVTRPDVGVVTLTGAVEATLQESDPLLLFRDVGGCLQGEFGAGVFVDRLEAPGEELGTTEFTLSGTAEIGVVGADTRGDVPVEVELNVLNEIMNADDDLRYTGTGTLTILDQRIVNLPDDFVAPDLSLELAAELTNNDGESVSLSWVDSIGFICN